MCGACYSGFADVAGTSAPFAAAGVAVARHRWKLRLGRLVGRHRPGAEQPELPDTVDELVG